MDNNRLGGSNYSDKNQGRGGEFTRKQVEAARLGKEQEEQNKKTDNQASTSRRVDRDKQKVEDQKPSQ